MASVRKSGDGCISGRAVRRVYWGNRNDDSRLRVELPYPPSVNHYWEPCVYKNAGKLYEAAGSQRRRLFIATMELLARRKNAVIGRVGVLLTVFFPDRKVRDLDNLLKGVLDGLVAAGG